MSSPTALFLTLSSLFGTLPCPRSFVSVHVCARVRKCMNMLHFVSWHIIKGNSSEREKVEQRRVCPLDLQWVASQHSSLCVISAYSDPVYFSGPVTVLLLTGGT